jgi:hypothetical protein
MMKKVSSLALSLLFCAGFAFAADQTLTGKISDSMCGHSHKSAIEHSGKKLTDHDCVIACVKNGGKYVFVSGGKIYNIANQDYSGLEEHAGHNVKLTGQVSGDTVTVSNITMSAGKSGGKS